MEGARLEQAVSNPSRWDIFCTVVDNFGDIGVTWRLARQLVAEHGLAIRLWVDNLATFISLCPEADLIERQFCQGVEVCHWSDPWCGAQPAQVVIEAFACELPAAYLEAMQASSERILWLNLEYLSAEAWVRDCHGLPSLHISGLQKYFFFPGFQADTGSLLREQDLLVQRSAFQADLAAQQAFLQSLNIPWQPGAWWVSLFAYENAALAEWLDSLACGPQMTQLLIPVGRVLPDVARWLGVEALNAGDRYQQDAVHIHVLPFLTQDQYDPCSGVVILTRCAGRSLLSAPNGRQGRWFGISTRKKMTPIG